MTDNIPSKIIISGPVTNASSAGGIQSKTWKLYCNLDPNDPGNARFFQNMWPGSPQEEFVNKHGYGKQFMGSIRALFNKDGVILPLDMYDNYYTFEVMQYELSSAPRNVKTIHEAIKEIIHRFKRYNRWRDTNESLDLVENNDLQYTIDKSTSTITSIRGSFAGRVDTWLLNYGHETIGIIKAEFDKYGVIVPVLATVLANDTEKTHYYDYQVLHNRRTKIRNTATTIYNAIEDIINWYKQFSKTDESIELAENNISKTDNMPTKIALVGPNIFQLDTDGNRRKTWALYRYYKLNDPSDPISLNYFDRLKWKSSSSPEVKYFIEHGYGRELMGEIYANFDKYDVPLPIGESGDHYRVEASLFSERTEEHHLNDVGEAKTLIEAIKICTNAFNNCPSRTGRLRESIELVENNNPEYSITRQVNNKVWSLSQYKHIGSVVYKLYFREDHNSYKLIGKIESYILEGNTIDANYFVSNIPPYDPYMYRGYPVDDHGAELRTKTKFSNSLNDLIRQFIEYHKNLQNLNEIKSDKKQNNKSEFRVEKSVVNDGGGWETMYYTIHHNNTPIARIQYAQKEGVPQTDRWQNKMYIWQIIATDLAIINTLGTTDSLNDAVKKILSIYNTHRKITENSNEEKNTTGFKIYSTIETGPKTDGQSRNVYYNGKYLGRILSELNKNDGTAISNAFDNRYQYKWMAVDSDFRGPIILRSGNTDSLTFAMQAILDSHRANKTLKENSNNEKNNTGFFKIYSKIENGPKTDLQTRSVYYNGRYLGKVQSELNKDTGTTIPDTYGTVYQYRWMVDNNHSSISSGFTNSLTIAIQKILEIHRANKTLKENSNNEKNNTGFRVNTWVEKFETSDLQYRTVFYNGKYLGEVISVLDKATGMPIPDAYAAKPAPGWIYGPPETDDKYMYRWVAKLRVDITLGYGNTNSLTDGIQQIIDTHRKNKTITENTEEVTTNNKYHVVKTDIKRGNEEINNFEVFCDGKTIGSAVRVSVDKIINPVYWNGKSTYNWYVHGKYIAGISHGYTDSLHEAISNIIKNHKVISLLIKVPANEDKKPSQTNKAVKNKKYSTKVYREDPLPNGGYLNTIEIYFGKELIGEINWGLTNDKILDMTIEPPFEARFFKADVNKIDDIVQRSKNISHQYFNSIISASKWIIENHKKLSTSKDKKSSPMNEAMKNKIYSTKVYAEDLVSLPVSLEKSYVKRMEIFFGKNLIGSIIWYLTKDKTIDLTFEPLVRAIFYKSIKNYGRETLIRKGFDDIASASKWIIESHKQMLKDKKK